MRLTVSCGALALTILSPVCRADDPQPAGTSPSLATLAADAPRKPGWHWVNYGVATLWAGAAADIGTSWKQPEGNSWLRQDSGANGGRFYTSGLESKLMLTSAVTVATYLIAWKKPKTRKYLGVLNFALGGAQVAVAASNLTRNPNLH